MKTMKTINHIILGMALLGTLPMMTACSDDDNNTPVEPAPVEEPRFEFVSELPDPPTFIFSTAGNKVSTIAFNTNQKWHVDLVNSQDSTEIYKWLTLFDRKGEGSDATQYVWIATGANDTYDARRAEFTLTIGEGEDATVKTFWVYQYQKDAILATDPKAFLNLGSDEQVLPLEFQYNVEEYEITGLPNWLTVMDEAPQQTRAMVSATKYVKVAANNTFDVRTCNLTIKDKNTANTAAVIPVAQYGLATPVIVVTNPGNFSALPASESAIDVNLVTENVTSVCDQLTIDIPTNAKDWLSFEANADSTGYILKVKENAAGARSAKVAVAAKADHKVKYDLTVKQASADGVTVAISNKTAFDENMSKRGGTFSLKYATDEENWDCAIEDADGNPVDWIKVANRKMPGQILCTFDANPNLRSRTAIFKIFPVGREDKADKVTMIQAAGTQIVMNGSIENTLNKLVEQGIYKSIKDITSLELKGNVTRNDLTKLSTWLKDDSYKLSELDLSESTNSVMNQSMFRNCKNLKKIVFPKALRNMEQLVCGDCPNLVSAKIPEGVEYVANHTFKGCPKLQEVWIPSTVKYLYGSVFEGCTGLRKIHFQTLPLQYREVCRSMSQPMANAQVFDEATRKLMGANITLYVPTNYVDYWKNPDPQHVATSYLEEYLKDATSTSEKWTKPQPAFEGKPGSAWALKIEFTWGYAAIVPEDAWAEE